MFKLIARRLLLPGLALLLGACSSQPAGPTQPAPFAGGSAVAITAQPTAAVKVTPPFAFCPVATPVVMPFLVTVTPTGAVAFVVTNITTTFTSVTGIQAPPITLPAPIPTTQFGTALEQAKNPQSFAFDVCRTASSGTVVVIVETRDTFGRMATGSITVPVR